MKTATIKEFFRDRFGDHGMGRVWNWMDDKIVDPQEDFSSSDEEEEIGNNANPYAPGSDKWPTEPAQDNDKDTDGNVSSGDGGDGGAAGGGGGGSGGGAGGKGSRNGGSAGRNVKHADAAEKRMADTKNAPPTPIEKELQDKNQKLQELQDKNKELQDQLSKVEKALALASTPLPTMARHDEYEREEMLSQGGWTARSAATSTGGSPPGRHPRRKKVSVQYLGPNSLPPISGQMYRNWPLDANTPHRSTDIHADTPQPTSLGPVSMVYGQLPSSNQQSKIYPTTSTYDSPSSRK